MRIFRDGKEIELTPEELNEAYKEQSQKIQDSNKKAVAKLNQGQEIAFHPIRHMYRMRLDRDTALKLIELMQKHPEMFAFKPLVFEQNGHMEIAFDKQDLPAINALYEEIMHEKPKDKAIALPDYKTIDIYQKSPGFMEGSFRLRGEKVRFEMDRRDGRVVFEPHDYARLTREGQLTEAEMIAQIITRDYVREAMDVAYASRSQDEIALLYQLKDRDMNDPINRELRKWDLDIAYQDFAMVYMGQLAKRDPSREMEQVKNLQYAVSLMDRGLNENDEKCMKEGFAIASDALSAITHRDIKLTNDPSRVEAVRDIAVRAQDDVRQYIEDGNVDKTKIRDHIEKSLKEHDFWDMPNGDRVHQTTTREKSIDIER